MQHEMQHGAYKPHKTVVFYGSDSRQQLGKSLDDSRDFLLSGHGSCRHLIYFPVLYFISYTSGAAVQSVPSQCLAGCPGRSIRQEYQAGVSGRNIK
jgi:hypothetical protein